MRVLGPIALACLLGCVAPDKPLVPEGPGIPEYVPTDVTFYAFGDPQYGGGADDKNDFQVTALNAFAGAAWPDGTPFEGDAVEDVRGVIIAGDLTQNGQDGRIEPLDSDELGRFEADYGLTGVESRLELPVYEGYGNHDFDPDEPGDWEAFDWRSYYDKDPTPSADRVSERSPDRLGLRTVAPGDDGHYSWDWDWLHLVQLNLCPADEPSDEDATSRVRDPRDALAFLEEDLAESVGDSGRPIVLMSHYGFDAFSQEPRWWTDDQKEDFLDAVDGYNVALLHGSERGRIGPLSGSLGVSASDSPRFRHPELGHAIEDVHTDHRFPSLSLRRP
ncbi:MAG: hypothetical protein GY898_00695 [Proteobacteria bacterium]|nr:hypothetical protein [Pseudomonadota bacterium]